MDQFTSLITSIELDAILSDPMLLVGSIFVILGPIVFLVALWKFVTFKKADEFVVPEETMAEPEPETEISSIISRHVKTDTPESSGHLQPNKEPVQETELASPSASVPRQEVDSERTIVLPPGVADMQAQMEIAFTQIKSLNKLVHQLEEQIESLSRQIVSRLDPNQMKGSGEGSDDVSKKLMTLAEHVVALEKEVARLKGQNGPSPTTPPPRPPIMPL